MTLGADSIRQALDGDVAAVVPISQLSHDGLLDASAELGVLELRADAVAAVVKAYTTSQLPAVDVQRWASFVRRGYVSGRAGAIRPLDIRYEPVHEAAIAEALARLDELGDVVDGELDEDEARALLRDLEARTPS